MVIKKKKKMVMNDAIMIYAGKLKRNSINDREWLRHERRPRCDDDLETMISSFIHKSRTFH